MWTSVSPWEEALAALHAIAPSSLFEQLFVVALGGAVHVAGIKT